MESQDSGLAKSDQESHAMRVPCIIIHIVHIISSYAMRPWNHGLDIKTSQNEGSTYGTSTREPSLINT